MNKIDMEEIIEDERPYKAKGKLLKSNKFIFSVFNLATFVEYFNLQFLPSSMRALEMSMGLTARQITNFSMAENFGLVASFPVWGALSDKLEVKYIMLFGVLMSGIISIWLSGISNYVVALILRIFNGAMMGSVTPSTQKYVVMNMKNNYGKAFGLVHSVMCLARMISSVVVTNFSTGTYYNFDGWRVCLFGFGVSTLILSPLTLLIPRMNKIKEQDYIKTTFKEKTKKLVNYVVLMIKESMKTPTSIIMTILVFFSDGPFVAFSFVTLLIQYMGLSNIKAGITSGLIIIGGIIGGIVGGIVSDYFDRKSPKYGLLIFANVNVAVRIVTFGVAFAGVNVDTVEKLYPLLALCLVLNGVTYMTVSCVDRTIIAKVVMPSFHSSSISIIRCISGLTSTLIFNPILAQLRDGVFGFERTKLDVKDMPRELLKKNSDALRYSIAILSVSTTIVVFLLYIGMCFTYGRDSKRVETRIKDESEMKLEDKELEILV